MSLADVVQQKAGGGFALYGGGCRDDEFLAIIQPRPEIMQSELIRPDAVHRRERTVEDVINAVIGAGLFDSIDVRRLFYDADETLVARRTAAIGAGINVSDVVANRAESEVLLEREDSLRERCGVRIAPAQDVEGIALRGFRADAGKLAELVDQTGHGFGEAGSHRQ